MCEVRGFFFLRLDLSLFAVAAEFKATAGAPIDAGASFFAHVEAEGERQKTERARVPSDALIIATNFGNYRDARKSIDGERQAAMSAVCTCRRRRRRRRRCLASRFLNCNCTLM